jgi:hypothetical protein
MILSDMPVASTNGGGGGITGFYIAQSHLDQGPPDQALGGNGVESLELSSRDEQYN